MQCRLGIGIETGVMHSSVAHGIQLFSRRSWNRQDLSHQALHSVLTCQVDGIRSLGGLNDREDRIHHFGEASLRCCFVIPLHRVEEASDGIRGWRSDGLCQLFQSFGGPREHDMYMIPYRRSTNEVQLLPVDQGRQDRDRARDLTTSIDADVFSDCCPGYIGAVGRLSSPTKCELRAASHRLNHTVCQYVVCHTWSTS